MCLRDGRVKTATYVNKFPVEVSIDDWWQPVEVTRQRVKNGANLSPWACLLLYSICPVPLFTDLSIELWSLYSSCGGTSRVRTPAEYYGLPALYVDACKVIDAELEEVRRGDSK